MAARLRNLKELHPFPDSNFPQFQPFHAIAGVVTDESFVCFVAPDDGNKYFMRYNFCTLQWERTLQWRISNFELPFEVERTRCTLWQPRLHVIDGDLVELRFIVKVAGRPFAVYTLHFGHDSMRIWTMFELSSPALLGKYRCPFTSNVCIAIVDTIDSEVPIYVVELRGTMVKWQLNDVASSIKSEQFTTLEKIERKNLISGEATADSLVIMHGQSSNYVDKFIVINKRTGAVREVFVDVEPGLESNVFPFRPLIDGNLLLIPTGYDDGMNHHEFDAVKGTLRADVPGSLGLHPAWSERYWMDGPRRRVVCIHQTSWTLQMLYMKASTVPTLREIALSTVVTALPKRVRERLSEAHVHTAEELVAFAHKPK